MKNHCFLIIFETYSLFNITIGLAQSVIVKDALLAAFKISESLRADENIRGVSIIPSSWFPPVSVDPM